MNAGSIPFELSELSNLEKLDLSRNDLSGEVTWHNLLVIFMNAGIVPPQLSELSNLTVFRIGENDLLKGKILSYRLV